MRELANIEEISDLCFLFKFMKVNMDRLIDKNQ